MSEACVRLRYCARTQHHAHRGSVEGFALVVVQQPTEILADDLALVTARRGERRESERASERERERERERESEREREVECVSVVCIILDRV